MATTSEKLLEFVSFGVSKLISSLMAYETIYELSKAENEQYSSETSTKARSVFRILQGLWLSMLVLACISTLDQWHRIKTGVFLLCEMIGIVMLGHRDNLYFKFMTGTVFTLHASSLLYDIYDAAIPNTNLLLYFTIGQIVISGCCSVLFFRECRKPKPSSPPFMYQSAPYHVVQLSHRTSLHEAPSPGVDFKLFSGNCSHALRTIFMQDTGVTMSLLAESKLEYDAIESPSGLSEQTDHGSFNLDRKTIFVLSCCVMQMITSCCMLYLEPFCYWHIIGIQSCIILFLSIWLGHQKGCYLYFGTSSAYFLWNIYYFYISNTSMVQILCLTNDLAIIPLGIASTLYWQQATLNEEKFQVLPTPASALGRVVYQCTDNGYTNDNFPTTPQIQYESPPSTPKQSIAISPSRLYSSLISPNLFSSTA